MQKLVEKLKLWFQSNQKELLITALASLVLGGLYLLYLFTIGIPATQAQLNSF